MKSRLWLAVVLACAFLAGMGGMLLQGAAAATELPVLAMLGAAGLGCGVVLLANRA